MTLRFDENHLLRRLSALSRPALIAFADACAARLENTACRVSADQELKSLLSNVMEAIASYLGNESPFDALAAEERLLAAMPDEDANPDFASAIAEDAAAAAVYTLRQIRDGNPQNAVWAARRAYETADREVLGHLNVGTVGTSEEAYILQHPVVQTELKRQLRDLDAISEVGGDSPAELVAIIARAQSENILELR